VPEVADLLRQVNAHGVELLADGERLLASHADRLPTELRAELRAHRDEVLNALRGAAVEDRDRAVLDARALVPGWRGAAHELAERAGWPRLSFKAAHAVGPGEAVWRLFVTRASTADLVLVVAALRVHLDAMPLPPQRGRGAGG
jgi:hypothetical protein